MTGSRDRPELPPAGALVARMQRHGIVEGMTGRRRSRRFRYASYIALFED